MNDERLESLLRAAGRLPDPLPPSRRDLADRVRRRYRRGRRARQVSSAGIAAMLLLGGAVSAWFFMAAAVHAPDAPVADGPNLPGETNHPSPQQRERLLAEIARLDAEATRRHRKVERMLQGATTVRPFAEPAWQPEVPDPLELARIEIEKTAFLLVDYAQRRSISADSDAVAQEYRRVVELFPHTNAAKTARKKLSQLSIEKGDL